MKGIRAVTGRALVLTIAFFIIHNSYAQSGYTVTERGPDWKVLQKTTVEHGTNHVHHYVELATGLNYTNAAGQWVEAKEEITLLPTGGAVANQGRHQVYFPADIYNGVLEVVTPDGRHLRSRPLGVSYDDGSNTVFIATLKHAIGYLTSSNTVTYRDAFDGFKADLVCQYRRGGFECDLVFRQQPPAPGDYGLDDSFSTLQMVTEFFNTADPEQIPAGSDDWFGLQDTTLKFGSLTMTHGKAFGFSGTNAAPQVRTQTPVYKSWLHTQGRTFLIEQVPLLNIAEDLDALPLMASAAPVAPKPGEGGSIQRPTSSTKYLASSSHRIFPAAHGLVTDTNQILLATADFSHEPGVVLDYTTVDSGMDTTLTAGTYFVMGDNYFDSLTYGSGVIIKFYPGYVWSSDGPGRLLTGSFNVDTGDFSSGTPSPPIFTSMNDDSVGDVVDGSTGTPDIISGAGLVAGGGDFGYGGKCYYLDGAVDLQTTNPVTMSGWHFENCNAGIYQGGSEDLTLNLTDSQFTNCRACVYQNNDCSIKLSLGNVALTGCDYLFSGEAGYDQPNNFICSLNPFTVQGGDNVYVDLDYDYMDMHGVLPLWLTFSWNGGVIASGSGAQTGHVQVPVSGTEQAVTNLAIAYYDGGISCSGGSGFAPNLNGLDWWSWETKYFGRQGLDPNSPDGAGNTLVSDYQNGTDPNVISFSSAATNNYTRTSNTTLHLDITAGIPYYYTILVDNTNFDTANWMAYDAADFAVGLGTNEGWHEVWIGLKGLPDEATVTWQWTRLKLDTLPPQIVITNPVSGTIDVPMIQLDGYSLEDLMSISYDITNAIGLLTNQPVSVSDRFYDSQAWEFKTNTFQGYDIFLTNGINIITVHAADRAGNMMTTNFTFTVDYSTKTNPPLVSLIWPVDGTLISGNSFTLDGKLADPTATVLARITDTAGNTNEVAGLVERNGRFWVQNLPLSAGTNTLVLTITDVVGNTTVTNINLTQASLVLTLDPVGDTEQLWQPTINLTGTISHPAYAVWVNGVKGTNNGDGTWSASNVPVDSGGTASFTITGYSPDETQPDGSHGN